MKRIWFLVLLLPLSLAFASDASACSCGGKPSIAASKRSYHRIFAGEVVNIERKTSTIIVLGKFVLGKVSELFGGQGYDSTGRDYGLQVTFRTSRTFQGPALPEVVVNTGFGGGDCGYRFEVGGSYLVYAREVKNGSPDVGICSRTGTLEERHDDIVELRLAYN